ncbi:hypothetical protein ACFLYT_00945, partial [Nanoarchaeota archaeon]
MNATVEDELGVRINNSKARFYVNTVGEVNNTDSGNNGLYEVSWDPSNSLTPGTYVVYANAENVSYYHNYTSTAPNSTTDVYGLLNPNLTLSQYVIYRSDSYGTYESVFIANLTDENLVAVSGVNVNFTIDTTNNTNTTYANGIGNYTYNPENDKVPANYTVILNASKQYYWKGDDVSSIIIKGILVPNITVPDNETRFHRGSMIELNSTLLDENGVGMVADNYNWTLVETSEDLGESANSTWNVPINHGIGSYTINFSTEKQYYDDASDIITIDIFGNSTVKIITTQQTVYRGNTVLYQANVSDMNGTALSDYNCTWIVNEAQVNISTTGTDGICNYTFVPSCSYNVGVQSMNVSIVSYDDIYYDATNSNKNSTVVIRDALGITIDYPITNLSMHRTDTVTLNSTAADYCGIPPTDSYSISWYNETNVAIASGERTSFIVPAYHGLGLSNISANVSGDYYDPAINATNIFVYGWSKVNNLTPVTTSFLRGEQVAFNCTILDTNTSEPLTGYPVEFLKEDISQLNTSTNSLGVANWTWNTTPESPGLKNITCRISDNSTMYYNASITSITTTKDVEAKLNVAVLILDNTTIYRKDLYDPYLLNITVRIDESALGAIANATAHIITPEGELTCNSSSDGYCSVIWNATETIVPGNYTIYANATKSAYDPADTVNDSIAVKGKLSIIISNPSPGIYHKGETLNLQSAAYDENGGQVGSMPTVTWYNSNGSQIMQSAGWTTNDNWQIPSNYTHGNDTLYANVNRQWFDPSSDSIDTVIWGYSNVSYISPVSDNYSYGTAINISCIVKDTNSSSNLSEYNVSFYYNNTLMGINTTDNTGTAVHRWEPIWSGNYLFRCIIDDNNVQYYNKTVSEGNQEIIIVDTTVPVVRNFNLSTGELETHQIIGFTANITDDINISSVWISVVKPDYSQFNLTLNKVPNSEYVINSSYPALYGTRYNISYSPDIGGFYNVTFYTNDTSNNIQSTQTTRFEAVPGTTVDNVLLPDTANIYNLTQTQNQSFLMNVTCNNTGRVNAYSTNITIGIPNGWETSIIFPQECGDIASGAYCIREYNVTVPAKALGTYYVNTTCLWTNPNLTRYNYSDSSTVVIAESNPILEVVESLISTTVTHNQDNITTMNISATGNDGLSRISMTCSPGDVCNNFTVNFSNNMFNITAGGLEEITVNVSVPIGFDPGTYYSEIKANATNTTCAYDGNCWDNTSIAVIVPTTKTWNRNPENISIASVYVNTTNYYGNVTINNTGNIVLSFNLSAVGNVSSLLVFNSNITVTKQNTSTFNIDYSIPLTQDPGTYTGNITIIAEGASIPIQLNVGVGITVSDNVNPAISNFTIVTQSTPGLIDMDKETVTFRANITDNIGISNVWICDDAGAVQELGCQPMINISADIYEYSYNSSAAGSHSGYIFAKDTSNNNALSSTLNFDVIDDTTGEIIPDPIFIEVSDLTYTSNSTFTINITFNNTGQGGAYDSNITLVMPNTNFTATSLFEQCGKIEEAAASDYCMKTFNITLAPATAIDYYNISAYANWTNADDTPGSASNIIVVKITGKEWTRVPVQISKTVYTNASGEFGQVLVNNSGEIPVKININYTGNGSSLVSVSETYLNLLNETTQNITINYTIPLNQAIGMYLVIIDFTNSSLYPPILSTTLYINVTDMVPPTILNTSLSEASIEANYENITISAEATDNVNISIVWAHVISPSYEENVTMNYSSGNNYSVIYAPPFGGWYNVTIYVRDTSGNMDNLSAGSFEVNGTTAGDVNALPDSKYVTGIVYGMPYSFEVNATINNTGNATMREVNVTIIPEYGGAWTAEITILSCGTINTGGSCYINFTIDLPDGASPGSKDVIFNVSWKNPDYTFNSVSDTVQVDIESNPILNVSENNLSAIINHSSNKDVGTFTIDSLGNTFVTGI